MDTTDTMDTMDTMDTNGIEQITWAMKEECEDKQSKVTAAEEELQQCKAAAAAKKAAEAKKAAPAEDPCAKPKKMDDKFCQDLKQVSDPCPCDKYIKKTGKHCKPRTN